MASEENYTTLAAKLYSCRSALQAEGERHAKAMKTLQNEKSGIEQKLALLDAGQDLDQIAVAKSVMYRRGRYAHGGSERASVIYDAIAYFANSDTLRPHQSLKAGYFGTKDYDRWHGQRSDHSYGMGPRHGSIVFAVGLHSDARDRDLTEVERSACIYYLRNIEKIEAAEVESAQ